MDFHDLLDCWDKEKVTGKAVLATIVKVQGHAYRKLGASMLLFEDGGRAGGISPGCLEADLEERVAAVLAEGRTQYVEYDMRNPDDFAWGEAIGCGGSIHVLMEPVNERLDRVLSGIKAELDRGQGCLLSRVWDADGLVSYTIEQAEKQGLQGIAGRRSLQIYCEPRPRLIIFGAGTDAQPLAAMAKQAGFNVIVADWREKLCCSGKFPDACDTRVGTPAELVEGLRINGADYVVIMSHQMERDRQLLDLLWPLAPRYAGLLGSKTRAAQLLNDRMPPAWLRFPVGLPIGAEGPVEIAISVVAELIAVKRSKMELNRGGGAHGHQGNRHLLGGWSKPAYAAAKALYPAWQKR
ncbi:MAG: putative xanthine dehydrogenase [Paenibacillus sp.]|nr:putative xanthine dehydrogenase [Paenibacillus sp.]